MQVNLKADLATRINRVAGASGVDPSAIVEQLVEHYIDHDEWFRLEVEKGIDEANRGQLIDHEEVVRRIEERISSKTG